MKLRRPRSIGSAARVWLLCGTAIPGLGGGSAALAQSTAPTVETVTVTAERKQENIMSVGVNVTAFSSEDLRQSRIVNATDLASQVPNLDVKTDIPGAQQIITLRGVGLDDFSSTNESAVGIYNDDVYLASFAEADFTMFDLADVEVLKGPQGTLYGRNSTAGAIKLTSAKPSFDQLDGFAEAGYGNYDTFEANGWVNIPLASDLALRFSAQTTQQGTGYWFSRLLDTDLGEQDVFHERGQALWQPASALTVLLKIEGQEDNSSIGVGKFFGTISTNAAPCPDFAHPGHCVDFLGYTDTTSDPFQGDWNHLAPYKVQEFNSTLHMDDDLGWAVLSSITGYINFNRSFYIDADASPATISEFDQNDDIKQFSEELRLAATTDGIDWQTGAYYSWDKIHSYTPGSLRDLLDADVLIHSDQSTTSAALYGQAKWPLTSQLALVSGLRATYEDRSYDGGSDFVISGTHIPLFHTFEGDTIDNRNISWHGGLNWNPDADTLVYAFAAQSTKSGGFFNGITTTSAALAPYKPEHLTDYELGLKSSVLGDTLLVDSSAFYYDYHDYQSQTFTNVGAVSLIKLSNIREASIYGLDLGLTWLPVDGMTLRGGLGLLHSRLGSFPYITASGGNLEPAGNRMPDAPTASFNGQARYEHQVFGNYVGAVQFAGTYEDANFKEALNVPYLNSPASWVFDGRVSLATMDQNWEIAFWIKNMFDEEHAIQVTDDGDSVGYRMFNDPRTFGVTLTHHFE
jgi:iron complex outermembrane receptor protein